MKTKFKNLFRVLLLFIAMLALFAMSQPKALAQADETLVYDAGTNVLAASSNYTALADFTIARSANVGVAFRFKFTIAGTNNIVPVTVTPRSATLGTSTVSANATTFNVPLNGTTNVIWLTNWNSGGITDWRLSINNTNTAGAVTNAIVYVVTKNGL